MNYIEGALAGYAEFIPDLWNLQLSDVPERGCCPGLKGAGLEEGVFQSSDGSAESGRGLEGRTGPA